MLLNDSLTILKDDKDICQQIEICENRVTNIALSLAAGYAAGGDYSSAIATLTSVIIMNEQIEDKLNEYKSLYRQVFLDKAEDYFIDNEYRAAIECLNEGIQKCGNDDEFMIRIAEYKGEYKISLFNEAEKLANMGEYEQAVAYLNASTSILTGDTEITQKIADYTKKFPVHLHDLSPCMGENHSELKEHQDIYGNKYSKGLMIWSYDNTDIFEYVANQQYKRFKSTILISNKTDDYVKLNIKIFADDILIYNSGEMTKKTEPIHLDLDISGAKFIRFEILIDGDVYNFRRGVLLLSDPTFCY